MLDFAYARFSGTHDMNEIEVGVIYSGKANFTLF